MLKQIEGSRAMAEAIALCRPQVICAYPITPQTHIVEGLGELVRLGQLTNCEFINVESEFAALSVAIGAPINIWNDHSDAMSMRDAGWIQLFAETNQEAADLHIQAFRLAEALSSPVMVRRRVHSDPCRRAGGCALPGERRCLPATLRAGPGTRSEGSDLDRRDGRPRCFYRGALPPALQAVAGTPPQSEPLRLPAARLPPPIST
jgi:TPP-dependent indolepyruvate ferredoxin oxidoreductase alpha subunit